MPRNAPRQRRPPAQRAVPCPCCPAWPQRTRWRLPADRPASNGKVRERGRKPETSADTTGVARRLQRRAHALSARRVGAGKARRLWMFAQTRVLSLLSLPLHCAVRRRHTRARVRSWPSKKSQRWLHRFRCKLRWRMRRLREHVQSDAAGGVRAPLGRQSR